MRHQYSTPATTTKQTSPSRERLLGKTPVRQAKKSGKTRIDIVNALVRAANRGSNRVRSREKSVDVGSVSGMLLLLAEKEPWLQNMIDSRIDERFEKLKAELSQMPVEAHFDLPSDFSPGYDNAVAAGAKFRAKTLARPDMLSSTAIGRLLSVSRETVNARRGEGLMVALTNGGRLVKYPAWQAELGINRLLSTVLRQFDKSLDCWSVYMFFTQENPMLGGKTPLALMRTGEVGDVISAASAWNEDFA